MKILSFHKDEKDETEDKVSALFFKLSQAALILAVGILPIFFIPSVDAPFNFSKSLFVAVVITFVFILKILLSLRRGKLIFSAPIALYAFWFLVVVSLVSALFSGDVKDAILGDMLGVYTVGFLLVMAFVMSVIYITEISKKTLKFILLALIGAGALLAVFHLFRLLFGSDFLTLAVFRDPFSSPYGMWNELAIFFGLIVVGGLVLIRQIRLSLINISVVVGITTLSLFMLMVVNFYLVWFLLAITSLLLLIQTLEANHNKRSLPFLHFIKTKEENLTTSVTYTIIIFIVSILFVVFNNYLASAINSFTKLQYVEVRPSVSATFNIFGQVVKDDPVLGIGPNKFIDAWRVYKDPAINKTQFWDTSFVGGSGFVPTGMTTTGLLGVLAWIVFLSVFFLQGILFLYRQPVFDKFWYFSGVLSFVLSLYLWIVAILYTPSVPTMLLTAFTTGIFLAIFGTFMPVRKFTIPLSDNLFKKTIVIFVAVLMLFGVILLLREAMGHYVVMYQYNKIINADDIDIRERWDRVISVFERSPNDVFARRILIRMLINLDGTISSTEEVDSQGRLDSFQDLTSRSIQLGRIAIQLDPTEPLNWIMLGQIYSVLTLADVEGAYDVGVQSYDKAREFDPTNPSILLLMAQLESRNGDFKTARSMVEEVLTMKPDYTEALYFSVQLDIVEGDMESALKKSQVIISIDPTNPVWLYQLGTLYMKTLDHTPAIDAFSRTLVFDPNFANARYFLALLLAEGGNFDEAVIQMQEVEKSNPDNPLVKQALELFAKGQSIPLPNSTSENPSEIIGEDILYGEEPVEANATTSHSTLNEEGDL